MLILFLIVVDHAGIAAQIYLGEPRPIIHNDGREPASPLALNAVEVWTWGESDSHLRFAKAACYHYTTGP